MGLCKGCDKDRQKGENVKILGLKGVRYCARQKGEVCPRNPKW